MATQTKQRPDTSDSQVTEEGLLIYAADQPVVETIPGDCRLFVDMVDKGFSFPGFEKLQVSEPELEKPRSFNQITDSMKSTAPKLALLILVFLLYFSFGGAYLMLRWLDELSSVTTHAVMSGLVSVLCLTSLISLFKDEDFREDFLFYPRALRKHWRESERVEKENERLLQSANRDPVTEKELIDYLMDVFSSHQDGKTITELRQYKKELEAERQKAIQRQEGVGRRIADKVRKENADSIDFVIRTAEARQAEVEDVQNRIGDFIREVREDTKQWINDYFPYYDDTKYLDKWIQESLEELSVTKKKIEEAEVKLIQAEQQFLERTETLSQLLTDANRYKVSLAEVRKNNYNDLQKLRS